MSVLICKMCGGDLEIKEGMTTVRCPYCGTNQTLPKFDDEKRLRLYDRANHYRRSNDYDKAMAMYEHILEEDQTDSEAYWGIVLCRYGIEYVDDPATHKKIPTVNRAQYTSILADEDYKAALRYADVVQAGIYEQEARVIDTIQRGILQVSQRETPYDIFICCKETDENGNRTRDSVLADELYYQLIRNNFKVFFARITLQDKPGAAYEPYIFAALHSARAMIVVGTSPENIQAAWVKNEWSRYLSLIKHGEKKVLIPAYRDMDPYDLPKEFSHLQALDMSRLGFVQDLIYGVNKIFGDDTRNGIREIASRNAEFTMAQQETKIPIPIEQKKRKKEEKTRGKQIGIALGIILVSIIALVDVVNNYKQLRASYKKNLAPLIDETKNEEETAKETFTAPNVEQTDQTQEVVDFTGVMEEFVSSVYKRPAKDVPESELAKMQQLIIKHDREWWEIGYSFEPPTDNVIKGFETDAEDDSGDGVVWMTFYVEEGISLRGLSRFSNLKKLDVSAVVDAEDIRGLPLESVSAYFANPAQAANMLDDPGLVRELGLNGNLKNLNGIEAFENLETLYISYCEPDNIDALIHVRHLKNLFLKSDANLTDFAVLGKLQDLEKLSLRADGLKSIKFVSSLKHLDTLKIECGELSALYGLEECETLRCFSISRCMELKEVSAVSELINLQELSLEIPYGCPEPELDNLTELRKLTLDGFEDCSFIENMTNLTELNLIYCDLPEGADLSNLTSLKKLSYDHNASNEVKIADIESFQTLEILDIQGSICYDDISGVFRMPNLKELDISSMYCELDFDAITENTTLEILHMNNTQLITNTRVERFNGALIGGWDYVALDEHMDFLKKFPELKELYLSEDELTDLNFAAGMSSLEILDISENYITDLKPLAELPSLQKVICAGNPIENDNVLRDSVVVITELEEE
ncbi:MAG: TIR domain-containing protein [Lachnospiraceae bacterium]|nr:TIR domain-containing protein [Lachnospiraceae bacterium]